MSVARKPTKSTPDARQLSIFALRMLLDKFKVINIRDSSFDSMCFILKHKVK